MVQFAKDDNKNIFQLDVPDIAKTSIGEDQVNNIVMCPLQEKFQTAFNYNASVDPLYLCIG